MDFNFLNILLGLFLLANIVAATTVAAWRFHISRQARYARDMETQWSQLLIEYALGLHPLDRVQQQMSHLSSQQEQYVLLLINELLGRLTGPARQRLYDFTISSDADFVATQLAASRFSSRRVRAALIFATLPTSESVKQLSDLTDDVDEQVRKRAIQSLGCLALPQCAPILVDIYEQRRSAPTGLVFHALMELRSAAQPAFIRGLASPHADLRMVAVAGLEMAPEHLRVVLDISRRVSDLVDDEFPEVRAAVAHALGSFADSDRDRDVFMLLHDPDTRVLRAAVRAARNHFTPEIAERIVGLAADESNPSALDAAQTIVYWLQHSREKIGPPGSDELLHSMLKPATMSSTLQRAQLEAALR